MSRWDDEKQRDAMRVRVNIRNALSDAVGADHGVTQKEIAALVPRLRDIAETIEERRRAGELPFLELPKQDVGPILDYVKTVRDRFDTLVVIGIGGSALGNIACHTALRHPYHNRLSADRRGGMRVEVPDNVDPDRLSGLFDTLDLKKTLFNVITKSGSTAETASTFLVIKKLLADAFGDGWREHIVVTTDRESGDLRKLAAREKLAAFAIPSGVGGRFSVLTPVGLLSCAASGIDIEELLAGARAMDERVRATPAEKNPAYVSAAVHYLLYNHPANPKRLAVMMPYSHALKDVADWFRQLWAESLGKEKSLDGRTVNVGPTPIKALGVTDQHSQVQLYTEGPNDKLFTFIRTDAFHRDIPFPDDGEVSDLSAFNYFGGKTMGQLLHAEQQATTLAITRKRRPSLTITVPEVRPYTVGQLFLLLEVQTVVAGGLFGIDPFDQPGVEAGKIATYALMDRPGYEDERKKIAAELGASEGHFL